MAQLDDQEFFRRPADHMNPVAVIVKHLAGNLALRWTDFLADDGEDAGRDRDGEFLLSDRDTRSSLLAAWDAAGSPSSTHLGDCRNRTSASL